MNAISKPGIGGAAYRVVDHTYDVVVVGAGGAGLSAAVYHGSLTRARPLGGLCGASPPRELLHARALRAITSLHRAPEELVRRLGRRERHLVPNVERLERRAPFARRDDEAREGRRHRPRTRDGLGRKRTRGERCAQVAVGRDALA